MAIPTQTAKMIERLERAARYLWATQVADGRATLDVGRFDESQAAMLSAGGASSVVRVDPGELSSLPGAGFDLVICFDVLETAADPEAVLDGIERALRPS